MWKEPVIHSNYGPVFKVKLKYLFFLFSLCTISHILLQSLDDFQCIQDNKLIQDKNQQEWVERGHMCWKTSLVFSTSNFLTRWGHYVCGPCHSLFKFSPVYPTPIWVSGDFTLCITAIHYVIRYWLVFCRYDNPNMMGKGLILFYSSCGDGVYSDQGSWKWEWKAGLPQRLLPLAHFLWLHVPKGPWPFPALPPFPHQVLKHMNLPGTFYSQVGIAKENCNWGLKILVICLSTLNSLVRVKTKNSETWKCVSGLRDACQPTAIPPPQAPYPSTPPTYL